jgi:putative Holliday junction resolvase
VAAVAADVEATEIVVGLPLRLDGSSGVAAEAVRQFAKALSERVTCGVVLWDERLSTVEASRQMRSAGVGSRKQRGVVDKVAAAVVLRSYLESRGGAAPDPGDVTMPEPVAPAPEERPRSKPRSRARAAAQRTRRDDWRRRLDDG